jgi:hypothetical protein
MPGARVALALVATLCDVARGRLDRRHRKHPDTEDRLLHHIVQLSKNYTEGHETVLQLVARIGCIIALNLQGANVVHRNLLFSLAIGGLMLPSAACGARTGLYVDAGDRADASAVDANHEPAPDALPAACPLYAPIPSPPPPSPGAACTFPGATGSTPAVLAAIAGMDLLTLTPQAAMKQLFHFTPASTSILRRSVVSRGDYIGAQVVSMPSSSSLEIELVLVHLDGTVVAHHRETLSTQSYGGQSGVVGNAAGTFAFGAGMGGLGSVWVALAQGTLLGPFNDAVLPSGGIYSPRVEPDARGRFLVLPADTNNSAAVEWLDPCTGVRNPAKLPGGYGLAGWGTTLFGITADGQLWTETADGMKLANHPSLSAQVPMWDFADGMAMFDVPPYPPGLSAKANLLIVNAATLADEPVALDYPFGMSVVPPDAWLSSVGDSNNPTGFGVDSSGEVAMFLSNGAGVIHLYVTTNAAEWTPIGAPVAYDKNFGPSYSLSWAEAAGTYVVAGLPPGGGSKVWQVVRPSAGFIASLTGPAQISRDGGCVSAFVSSNQLDVVNAVSGQLTSIALPSPTDAGAWVSTWIPGDDAIARAY